MFQPETIIKAEYLCLPEGSEYLEDSINSRVKLHDGTTYNRYVHNLDQNVSVRNDYY